MAAFWTNGGPGCSGLIGLLAEQGPYRVNADLTLSANQFAWNKFANMVFIEAPVGVGFSYSDNPDVDYVMGDAQTAADNYELIQAFLDRFSSLRSNDLYISSESYGGHYMPTLAMKILDENAAGAKAYINFKGLAVGNPYTDPFTGLVTMLDTMWGHQLLSRPTWTKYLANCTEEQVVDLEVAAAHNITIADPNGCEEIVRSLLDEAGAFDPYGKNDRDVLLHRHLN
jgi:carboxypeptidase C (cathepsin A)